MTTLTQNIHELTRPHLPAGATLDTEPVPALLEQLDAAVTAETRAGSAGSNEPAIPLGTGSLALKQDIDWRARDEHYRLTGSDTGTLAAIIQAWATITDHEWVVFLEHVTQDWIDQIRQILTPTKPPYRPAVPCPSCGVLYNSNGEGPGLRVHCWAEDENPLPLGEWTAECVHCGAGWQDAEAMGWLRASLLTAQKLPA